MDRHPTPTLYPQEDMEARPRRLKLSDGQRDRIRSITLGVEEVDLSVREMAADDVLATIENGHPLNRLLTNEGGDTTGYIACEDFVPREAYVKYFATTGGTGRNPLQEIPAFLNYARAQGYLKINFHGWNPRLNRILERFGFTRLRTDRMGSLVAEFYEVELAPGKTADQVDAERRAAFEQKYLTKLRRDYENTLATFSNKIPEGTRESSRTQKTNAIEATYRIVSRQLAGRGDEFPFGDIPQAVLKLKIARHFQNNNTLDTNVLVDAALESPKFFETDKGSLYRLLEIHEQKTIMLIAERRKRKAEQTDNGGFNPYEALFTTVSGDYYISRLLNMPHLEAESDYMTHCVGNSDSYISKMKRGDIEILSLRRLGKLDEATQKYEEDKPVVTFEYNPRTGVMEQMKLAHDDYLSPNDAFYPDVMDALRRLPQTFSDTGKPRRVSRIQESELEALHLPTPKPGHVLTDQGEISIANYNPAESQVILKVGMFELNDQTPKDTVVKLLKIFQNVDADPSKIARNIGEVTPQTKILVGPIENTPEFFQLLPDHIDQIYTSLPGESTICRERVEIGGKTKDELKDLLKAQGHEIAPGSSFMMDDAERFVTTQNPEEAKLIRLTVKDLGFPQGATYGEIVKRALFLGLELCPPEVGPHYRLQYKDQPMNEWVFIGMEPIPGAGRYPDVFRVGRHGDGSWLDDGWTDPDDPWSAGRQIVFRLRKKSI